MVRLAAHRRAGGHPGQLDAGTGLAGRSRSAGSTAERARVAVRKAIVAALLKVVEVHPALGRHLHENIRTGSRLPLRAEPGRHSEQYLFYPLNSFLILLLHFCHTSHYSKPFFLPLL
jgi:hypothetical protein